MGFGKSLSKAVKKATKQIVGGAKDIISDPVSAAGVAAAPFTGGASLVATSAGLLKKKGLKETTGTTASNQEDIQGKYGWGSMAELIEARKKKEQELASRSEGRVSGISSLIGRGTTLG